ncbi:MAG TPA: hypothetical protein VLE97_11315 [Gaiellaceae bacterium]|nr:hypothetical protein [Gaiellaceae bacterium]
MDDWSYAHVYVGQAVTQMQQGAAPPPRGERRPRTPEEYLQRAGRSLGRAYQMFLRAGLTKEQAVARITSLAETFASLE